MYGIPAGELQEEASSIQHQVLFHPATVPSLPPSFRGGRQNGPPRISTGEAFTAPTGHRMQKALVSGVVTLYQPTICL